MIVSLRLLLLRLKYIVLFVVMTILLYKVFHLIGNWIEPVDRYRIPTGKAVKVFQQNEQAAAEQSMMDRLRLFYRYGE